MKGVHALPGAPIKKQAHKDPAQRTVKILSMLLLPSSPTSSSKTGKASSEENHGGWFRYWG
jgi:hypothetical protein